MARILIIERDVPVRCLLEVICERLGHEPVAREGEAVSARGSEFQLAVIEPADPAGLESARLLRAADSALPIVFVSAMQPASETRELEPRAHVVKPAPLGVLTAAIEDALA